MLTGSHFMSAKLHVMSQLFNAKTHRYRCCVVLMSYYCRDKCKGLGKNRQPQHPWTHPQAPKNLIHYPSLINVLTTFNTTTRNVLI